MKYLYLLLFSIVPAVVFSQTNFQKGYIIKSTGDTVRGYVDYQEWNRNPQSINFKSETDDKAVTVYTPENSSGFGINKYDLYRSYKCTISTGKTQEAGLSTGSIYAQVFLKVLVNGPLVKLYDYTDKIKSRYLVMTRLSGQGLNADN
jgi:hypothetical protein